MAAVLLSCGGEEPRSSSSEEEGGLRVFVGTGTPGEPSLVVEGGHATAVVWERLGAPSREVLYETNEGGERLRAFVNPSGEVERVVDEVRRTRIEVVQDEAGAPNEIYFLEFDLDSGAYASGYIMFTLDDSVRVARIVGRSPLSGQVTGQLADVIRGDTGSFALLPVGPSVGGAQEVLESGWVVEDVTAVSAGMLGLADGLVSLDHVQFRPPETSTDGRRGDLRTSGLFPRVLKVGGLMMIGASIAGVAAPAYAAAGVATGVAALFSNDIADALEAHFQTDETFPVVQEALGFIIDVLRDPGSEGVIGSLRAVEERVNELIEGTREVASEIAAEVEEVDLDRTSASDDNPTDVFRPDYRSARGGDPARDSHGDFV